MKSRGFGTFRKLSDQLDQAMVTPGSASGYKTSNHLSTVTKSAPQNSKSGNSVSVPACLLGKFHIPSRPLDKLVKGEHLR